MDIVKQNFLELALHLKALQFGEFVLKSGRISPYFFNMGQFNSGYALAGIAGAYADTIMQNKLEFDVLFGPAYKGIPLAAATSTALAINHNYPVNFAFNRKEVKDHGEGGEIVGTSLTNKRVLIIDDVITKGTAINEAMQILQRHQAICCGVVIALDRQELGQDNLSAVASVTKQYQVPVISIISLADILHFTQESNTLNDHQQKIKDYQATYGC